MKKLLSTALVCGLAFASLAQAMDADEKRVMTLVKQRMELEVASVHKTPYGLFEVVSGNRPFYVDRDVKFFFSGHVFDILSRKDLTQERIDELSVIDPSFLPADQAIVTKKGKGERVLYLFADPNCSYCKMLEKTLEEIDNLTLYTFVSPVLGSNDMVDRILGAENPEKTWRAWMLEGKTPPKGPKNVKWREKNAELADKLALDSVPILFFTDGTRIAGAAARDEIEGKLKKLYP